MLGAAFISLCVTVGAGDGRRSLAVLDLEGKGVDAELASNLTDVVTVALNKLGVFTVLSRADIQRMLEFEQSRQSMGCENDTGCLAEIGGALGVALLLSGSIGKVGSSYLLNLTLVDTGVAQVLAREQRQIATLEDLPRQVEAASRFVVRELLSGQQGELIISATERDAEVEIDGRLIGMTPLPRQALGGGPHTVKVHKQGFVSFARDVEIKSGEATVVDAALVPSLELVRDHEDAAFRWRLAAYVSAGVGAALLGYGIGGYVWNGDNIARYETNLRKNNCHVDATVAPTGDCSRFARRRATLNAYEPWPIAAMAVGSAALAAAAFCFFWGPQPGAYERFGEAGATLGITPLTGGAMLVAGAPY